MGSPGTGLAVQENRKAQPGGSQSRGCWVPIEAQLEPQLSPWQFRACKDQLCFCPGKSSARRLTKSRGAPGEPETSHWDKELFPTNSGHIQPAEDSRKVKEEDAEDFFFLPKVFCHHESLQAQ